MCSMVLQSHAGRNVLYITLEMAEEKILERIDANLLDVNIQDLTDLPHRIYENKIVKLAGRHGKLIIKEYPTALLSWAFLSSMTFCQERISSRYYIRRLFEYLCIF